MSLGRRPTTQSRRPRYRNNNPPPWLIFVLGLALVFGTYYLWLGVRNYLETGGFGVDSATARAQALTATNTIPPRGTPLEPLVILPEVTSTPPPECADFIVTVPSGIVRQSPSINSPILETLSEGSIVCVLRRETDEWYMIDRNPVTRRVETGYMRRDIIQAANPTPTPTGTFTPLPTITALPTSTPTPIPSPEPTTTPDPRVTPTPTLTPSLTPTPTFPVQSA